MGPLIDTGAVEQYLDALKAVEDQGGNVVVPGGVLEGEGYESGVTLSLLLQKLQRPRNRSARNVCSNLILDEV